MSKSHAFPFLRLPPEIRIIIYNLVLTSPGRSIVPYSSEITACRFRPTLSIVNVNRQIRYETLPILYGDNHFVFIPSTAARVLSLWDNVATRSLSSIAFNFDITSGGHMELDQALDLLVQAECLTYLRICFIRQNYSGQIITPLFELPHLDKLRKVKVYGTLRVTLVRLHYVVPDRPEGSEAFVADLRASMIKPKNEMIRRMDGGPQASST